MDKSFRAARPSIGYGMTETNAYGPGNTGDDYVRKPTSTGRVVPVVEMRVTDAEGRCSAGRGRRDLVPRRRT